MGIFSDDDINEAERMMKDLTPEKKKQLDFLKGFEEGWKHIRYTSRGVFTERGFRDSTHQTLKAIPTLWNWHHEWKSLVEADPDWLKSYGRIVGYLIGIMRFDPIALIRKESIEIAIDDIKKLVSEPLAGRKVDVMIKKMLKNHWNSTIKSQLNQLSLVEKQNYYIFIKSI